MPSAARKNRLNPLRGRRDAFGLNNSNRCIDRRLSTPRTELFTVFTGWPAGNTTIRYAARDFNDRRDRLLVYSWGKLPEVVAGFPVAKLASSVARATSREVLSPRPDSRATRNGEDTFLEVRDSLQGGEHFRIRCVSRYCSSRWQGHLAQRKLILTTEQSSVSFHELVHGHVRQEIVSRIALPSAGGFSLMLPLE